MNLDDYYTPDDLGRLMLAMVSQETPMRIADFASGNGALLHLAKEKFPKAQIFGTDIDPKVVRRLRRKNCDWNISNCDFLNQYSRSKAAALEKLIGDNMADLVLINPPFSYRGGKKHEASIQGSPFYVSKAMAFLIQAMSFLGERGELVAVLPQSTLRSERDLSAWVKIEEFCKITLGSTTVRGAFPGCHAKCILVSIKFGRTDKKELFGLTSKALHKTVNATLVRGSVPLHLIPKLRNSSGEKTLVHSTDLHGYKVYLNGRLAEGSKPSICGPAVLVHRVGRPRIDKVALYLRRKRIILSDCVIGLQCASSEEARSLHKLIIGNQDGYLDLYGGTCAPYTTVKRLRAFLHEIGCDSR